MTDPVKTPSHYRDGLPVESWDFIWSVCNRYKSGGDAYLVGCALAYLIRAPLKGAFLQDIKKAKQYIDKVLERFDEETD